MIPSGRLNGYSVNTLRDVLVSSTNTDSTDRGARRLEKEGRGPEFDGGMFQTRPDARARVVHVWGRF